MNDLVTKKCKKIKWTHLIALLCVVSLLFSNTITAGATEVSATATTESTAESTTESTAESATTTSGKGFIALGADLTPEQRQTVLALMGLTEESLSAYQVVTISNDMEQQYLGSYLDDSIIGTKSLSSVLVVPAEEGAGVTVTTQNIQYCTTDMYRNALLTAGVKDANIMVVAPFAISGTAGLIGALKAYETMTGEEISLSSVDTAMNELVTTSEIAKSASSKEVEDLISYLKAKVAAGELDSEKGIRAAIKEGEDKYGVSLSDEEEQKIVDFMLKVIKLGIDPNLLLDQAGDLYEQYGDELLEHPEKAFLAYAGDAVEEFFNDLGEMISEFFSSLFS